VRRSADGSKDLVTEARRQGDGRAAAATHHVFPDVSRCLASIQPPNNSLSSVANSVRALYLLWLVILDVLRSVKGVTHHCQ